MDPRACDRRGFLKASAGAASLAASVPTLLTGQAAASSSNTTLAALGGKPVRSERFPSWPVVEKNDLDSWVKVLKEGKWCRLDGHYASNFEQAYAQLTGTKHCTVTANGTSALFTSLNALGVGPGDEVLVPPYTF